MSSTLASFRAVLRAAASLPSWQLAAMTLAASASAALVLSWRARAGSKKTAVIAAIGTAVPTYIVDAPFYLKLCKAIGYSPELLERVNKFVASGGIEARRCVLPDSGAEYLARLAQPGKRAELWEEHAPELAIAAARNALSQWRHGSAADVTHVVVHSCTGFAAPGLDYALISALGLGSGTRKLGVNFMGCFGGMTSLYVAKQIIEADATGRAVVLLACSEICSVHASSDPNQRLELVMGNTLFSDGSSAAIVTHAGFRGTRRGSTPLPPAPTRVVVGAPFAVESDAWEWSLGGMGNEVIAGTAGAMTWRASPAAGAFDMWLDRAIPGALTGLFANKGLSMLMKVGVTNPFSCAWALHPGGKGILAGFEKALAKMRIKPVGIESSYDVLRQYGNMSSATILFVLQRVLSTTNRNVVFFAGFGPGLTVEYGALRRIQRGSGGAEVGGGEEGAPLAPGESPKAGDEEE